MSVQLGRMRSTVLPLQAAMEPVHQEFPMRMHGPCTRPRSDRALLRTPPCTPTAAHARAAHNPILIMLPLKPLSILMPALRPHLPDISPLWPLLRIKLALWPHSIMYHRPLCKPHLLWQQLRRRLLFQPPSRAHNWVQCRLATTHPLRQQLPLLLPRLIANTLNKGLLASTMCMECLLTLLLWPQALLLALLRPVHLLPLVPLRLAHRLLRQRRVRAWTSMRLATATWP